MMPSVSGSGALISQFETFVRSSSMEMLSKILLVNGRWHESLKKTFITTVLTAVKKNKQPTHARPARAG
jgi:hypothetical protein